MPLDEQGLKVLGAPVGQPEYILARLVEKGVEHDRLMEMISHVQDVQAAWLLLWGEFSVEDSAAGVDPRIRHTP